MLFDTIGKVSYHAGDSITSGVAAPNVGNKQLQSLIDANPYRNASYTVSPWNQFLSWLGFRTPADAWRENMAVQAQEYDASIMQKQYDQEYNDPASQVARMRQAGLNPDIDGGSSISPGQAAPLGEDPSTPMQSTGDDGVIMQVANGCLSAFSTALGLVQSVQGIQKSHLSNVMQSIANESAFSEFAAGIWPMFLPESPNPAAGDGESLFANDFDWQSAALKSAEKFAGRLPKNMRSKFISQVQQYWSSGPGQAQSYKDWSDRVKNRRAFYNERGTFYSDIDSVLEDIVKPLNDMTEKIYRSSQGAELAGAEAAQAKSENEQEYYSNLDAGLQAGAENAENKLSKINSDTAATLNATIEKIVQNLESSQKEGGLKGALSGIALAVIAGVRLWLVNVGAPSISRSSSQSTGKTNSTSQSFSIGF